MSRAAIAMKRIVVFSLAKSAIDCKCLINACGECINQRKKTRKERDTESLLRSANKLFQLLSNFVLCYMAQARENDIFHNKEEESSHRYQHQHPFFLHSSRLFWIFSLSYTTRQEEGIALSRIISKLFKLTSLLRKWKNKCQGALTIRS